MCSKAKKFCFNYLAGELSESAVQVNGLNDGYPRKLIFVLVLTPVTSGTSFQDFVSYDDSCNSKVSLDGLIFLYSNFTSFF